MTTGGERDIIPTPPVVFLGKGSAPFGVRTSKSDQIEKRVPRTGESIKFGAG